jgi:DNA polymerase-4
MMTEEPLRRILHADMDCFYAAVHTRDDLSLEGKPVVVGGDPSGRGVVAAANYEARKYGIHSAMPAAQARRRCPHTVFLRPDFSRYREESQLIFDIYRQYTPIIQPLSLDEAFLDVSEHLGEFGSATELAKDIRRRVREERRLTVSIGVAPNKLVAKIASDFDKPDGLTIVRPHEIEAFLAPLPVRRIYGIGPAAEQSLHEMGITTIAELRELSIDRLMTRFGSWGRVLWERVRGIDDRPVHTHRERKSLSTERTFAENVKDLDEIDRILDTMADEVAKGLKKRHLAASTITVKVRYPDFTTPTRSHSLPVPTSDAATIGAAARELVRRTDAARQSVRLLGVGASNLVPGELGQRTLFDDSAH